MSPMPPSFPERGDAPNGPAAKEKAQNSTRTMIRGKERQACRQRKFLSGAGRTLLIWAALACVVPGCSKPPTRVGVGDIAQILHKGNKSDPQELDPHIVQGVPEHHILQTLIENLVTEDPRDLTPVPGQAERWDVSPDGTVYTFHLRPGLRWSNGEPLTAHDFVRSYRRALTPSLGCEYAYMFFVMKGAEDFFKGRTGDFSTVGAKALDERTLRITLNGPVPYFLSLLNHYSWWPVHLPTIAKYGDPYQR